jgi:hypothetical protein
MMKILAGDWKVGHFARCELHSRIPFIAMPKAGLSEERIAIADIVSADVVTSENHTSILPKLGGAALGGLVMGPVGAAVLFWASGNRTDLILAVVFKDGRKALVRGKAREINRLLAAVNTWSKILAATHIPGSPAQEPQPFAPQPITPVPNPRPWRTWHKVTISILGALFLAVVTIPLWGPYVPHKPTPVADQAKASILRKH